MPTRQEASYLIGLGYMVGFFWLVLSWRQTELKEAVSYKSSPGDMGPIVTEVIV